MPNIILDPDTDDQNDIKQNPSRNDIDRGLEELESYANKPESRSQDNSSTNSYQPSVNDFESSHTGLPGASGLSSATKPWEKPKSSSTKAEQSSLYTGPGESPKKPVRLRLVGTLKKKKTIAGGGIIGALLAGGFGIFTFISGPMQFVHIGELLTGFHFGTLEDVADDRGSRLWRLARHKGISNPDDPGKARRYRRLGELGNRFANGVETRLQGKGITAEYNIRGNFDGYTFDPNTYENGRYRGDPEGLRNQLERNGITGEVHEGRVRASAEGGYFAKRRLISTVSAEAGYGKVLSKISKRVLRTRGAVTFHPIRRADERIKTNIAEWWRARKQRVNNGDTGVNPEVRDYETQDDFDLARSDDPDVEKPTPKNVDVDPDSLQRLKGGAFKAGGVGATAVAATCITYAISSNYDTLAHENINLPLMRLGMEYVSVAAQIKSGQDFDIEQLNNYSETLYDEGAETSALSARSIQYELGEPATGADIPESARPSTDKTAVSEFIEKIPGVGSVCKALESPIGQLATLGLDVAAGPISLLIAGADFAVGVTDKVVDFVINWVARDPVDIENLAGAELGSALNYGVRLAANEQSIAQGGTELTSTETARLDAIHKSIERDKRSQIAFHDRLFDVGDAYSLVSRVSISAPKSFGASVQLASSSLSFDGLVSGLVRTFSPKVLAQETYSYGFNEYGFSEAELNDPRIQDPYENLAWFDGTNEDGKDRLVAASDKYGECFGVSVDNNGVVTQLDSVAPNALPEKCKDNSEELLRFRFYLLDMSVANAGACYYGDNKACGDLGASAGGSETPPANEPINGLQSPPNLGAVNSEGYYQMPSATDGSYLLNTNGGSLPAEQCGSKELVDVIYTLLKKYNDTYGEKLGVGDLNASGHASHRKGIDVDIYGVPYNSQIMADHEKAVQLGKWAYDTGMVETIGYSYPNEVNSKVNSYAGSDVFMQNWSGHKDHFHIRLLPQYEGQVSERCAG